jgi:hypothetical protein
LQRIDPARNPSSIVKIAKKALTGSKLARHDANLDGGDIAGGWTLTFDVRPPAPAAGGILISEFRTRGDGTTPPGSDGSADEFIELYNNTDQSITIIDALPGADPTSPTGAGWRFSGAQGAAETTFLVLPQTLSTAGPLALPPRGYFTVSTRRLQFGQRSRLHRRHGTRACGRHHDGGSAFVDASTVQRPPAGHQQPRRLPARRHDG